MHIPDGYLSPGTCAALYAGAAPFWWVSLRRLKRAIDARLVPQLSLLAAFSFVVMMFNIPLPGGTTGHAVGAALSAIVIGPSAAILAVSTALAIQAFFFGDGGVTALGANCVNIAVIGPLVAFAVYRAIGGRAPIESPRRMVAAGLAGYAAVNASALAAAVEFGIQPLLFTDASGAPLYCPYPLRVAVPVMMAGHLTVAGLAEFVLTGGGVAFLQRTSPDLLSATAGAGMRPVRGGGGAPVSLRPLWIALGVLLVLTPLGLLAGGAAWGEWRASAFSDPAARSAIGAASLDQPPPSTAPAGLNRLSRLWTAPLPDYAPSWLRSRAVGYALSGMLGAGLVVLATTIVSTLVDSRRRSGGGSVGG